MMFICRAMSVACSSVALWYVAIIVQRTQWFEHRTSTAMDSFAACLLISAIALAFGIVQATKNAGGSNTTRMLLMAFSICPIPALLLLTFSGYLRVVPFYFLQ
jgi:hypothetical protein